MSADGTPQPLRGITAEAPAHSGKRVASTGKKLGRPFGAKTRAREQKMSMAAELAAKIVDSPEYFASLQHRAHTGTLPPGIEILLWYYRFGKPVNKVEVNHSESRHADLPPEELAERARELADKISKHNSIH